MEINMSEFNCFLIKKKAVTKDSYYPEEDKENIFDVIGDDLVLFLNFKFELDKQNIFKQTTYNEKQTTTQVILFTK